MENYETYNDDKLVGMLREKHPLCDFAFNVLYQRYRRKLFSYCLFLSNDREFASDLFQEAWIKFDLAAKDGKKIENSIAYLIGTARYSFLYDKRKNSNRSKLVDIDGTVILDDIMDRSMNVADYENRELISLIKSAVNSLDEMYREPFVLKRFDELTYNEIAAILGETVECIKSRVLRATVMVKDYLKVYIKELI